MNHAETQKTKNHQAWRDLELLCAGTIGKSHGPSRSTQIIAESSMGARILRSVAEESTPQTVPPAHAEHTDGAKRCGIEHIGCHEVDKNRQAFQRNPGKVHVGAAAALAKRNAQIRQNFYPCCSEESSFGTLEITVNRREAVATPTHAELKTLGKPGITRPQRHRDRDGPIAIHLGLASLIAVDVGIEQAAGPPALCVAQK